jgi:hypothetical protein
MVPYTGGTPQIINDMMGKKGSAQAKATDRASKFCCANA